MRLANYKINDIDISRNYASFDQKAWLPLHELIIDQRLYYISVDTAAEISYPEHRIDLLSDNVLFEEACWRLNFKDVKVVDNVMTNLDALDFNTIMTALQQEQPVFILDTTNNKQLENDIKCASAYLDLENQVTLVVNTQGQPQAVTPFELYQQYKTKLTPEMTTQTQIETLLNNVPTNTAINLVDKTAQIELLTQLGQTNKVPHVTEEEIEALKNTPAYQQLVDKLAQHKITLSKTQARNVLVQTIASQKGISPLFNLSDMGSGKTLMTVATIYLNHLYKIWLSRALIEEKRQFFTALNGRPVYIITPQLSVTSSWLDTLKLLYDIEETENGVNLTTEFLDIKTEQALFIKGFDVKKNRVSITHYPTAHKLPKLNESFVRSTPYNNSSAYIVIDEIHQLLESKTHLKKVLDNVLTLDQHLEVFILSGTLSQLTTRQLLNYYAQIKLINDPIKNANIPKLDGILDNLPKAHIKPLELVNQRAKGQLKFINFMDAYSPKIIKLSDDNESVTSLVNLETYDKPNIKLFHALTHDRAVTANAHTIAEELFGKSHKENLPQLIKLDVALSAHDLHCLKQVHRIAKDATQYENKNFANELNNTMLNLNDGLTNKNLLTVIEKFAEKNEKFLNYLTHLGDNRSDTHILEELKQSNLVKSVKLKDTDKFKYVNDLVNSNEDTYLIVVNDTTAMTKLSKALGIKALTTKQVNAIADAQQNIDTLFDEQRVVVVPQEMVRSSLDLVKANHLIQYQLNTHITDIIQTQNRINRIGQTNETNTTYIATDNLQSALLDLFLDTYKHIKVAHNGIMELFVETDKQMNIVDQIIDDVFENL